jgi:hypothetical protein
MPHSAAHGSVMDFQERARILGTHRSNIRFHHARPPELRRLPSTKGSSFQCGYRRFDRAFARVRVVKSRKIVEWRAAADEDGHYCFAVTL